MKHVLAVQGVLEELPKGDEEAINIERYQEHEEQEVPQTDTPVQGTTCSFSGEAQHNLKK